MTGHSMTEDDAGHVQDDVLKALGALVVNVAAMEESLHDAIMLLAGTENAAIGVLTAGLNFRTLVEKFGALCLELGTHRGTVDDVKGYCRHLNELNDKRNAIVHSAWNWLGSAGVRRYKRTAKVKSGFALNVTKTSPTEILEVAASFFQAERKIWEYVP